MRSKYAEYEFLRDIIPGSGVGDLRSKPKSIDSRREFLALDIGRWLSTMLFLFDSMNMVAAWSKETRGPSSSLKGVSFFFKNEANE